MKDRKLSRQLAVVGALGLLAVLSAAIGYAQVGGSFDLSWSTVDGGGGRSSAGGYELTGDIGQPDSTKLTYSNVYTLYGGFYWAGPVATPCAECPSPTPAPSPTACTVHFADVQPPDYFYSAVGYLYCHGAISGYSDGTFRPYNNTTRGQLSKIVTLANGWTIDVSNGPHFVDVPTTDPFYMYVETAYHHEIISGYSDGTFRPGNNVTRAQLSKIVALAQLWDVDTASGPHFRDVPTTDAFYNYIETAYHHEIISGYSDSTFRPGNNATRGQISKIVYGALNGPNDRGK